jgi:F420H(2)-dependent quinone reductase
LAETAQPDQPALLTRGIGPAPQHLLSIRGRRTGKLRVTPVAVIAYRGGRNIVAGYASSDWAHNARPFVGMIDRCRRNVPTRWAPACR